MTHKSSLHRLSEFAGIEPFYWDISGTHHETTDETRRQFLSAMGYDADTVEEARATLKTQEAKSWRQVLPPVSVLSDGDDPNASLDVTVPAEVCLETLTWTIEFEDGRSQSGQAAIAEMDVRARHHLDDVEYLRLALKLPHDLPHGYHRLSVEAGDAAGTAKLIVTPSRMYLPDGMDQGRTKLWGLACQVYALRREGDWGIGDFTALAELCRCTAKHGGAVIGLSPLHALFPTDPSRVSPYAPSSRLFVNFALIDVERVVGFADCALAHERLKESQVLDALKAARGDACVDYPTVMRHKQEILELLFAHFERAPSSGDHAFNDFVSAGGERLALFCAFEALTEHFDGAPPHLWPEAYRTAHAPAVKAFMKEHAQRLRFFQFVQWQADLQIAAASEQCATGGMTLGLYRDLAVGAVSDGADAWIDDEAYVQSVRIGAPPDAFSATGQDWGIPPFHPVALREAGYAPFIDMIRANMRHAGALRIDHAMWLQHVFWIPPQGDGRDGAYVRYPMDDLLKILALESHRNTCIVIGEDLGTVPEGFREAMDRAGVLSYRLMMFERYPDELFKRPDTYPTLALATPGSHDLPPIAGFWRARDLTTLHALGLIEDTTDLEARREQRQRDRVVLIAALIDQGLLEADFPADANLEGNNLERLIAAVHAFVARTPSVIAMANLEDVLSQDEQINIPGTINEHPNWRRRLALTTDDLERSGLIEACARIIARER